MLISKQLNYGNHKNLINNNINIFCQFFVSNNLERQKEINYVLKKNVNNRFINNIYLLNEKIYTDSELDIKSNKIIQVNIKKRLEFKDVFLFIKNNNIKGYNILINSDIFFDNSIENLLYSDLHNSRKMCALLRYEYNIHNINDSKLCGAENNSQDTWILHSNNELSYEDINNFDFEFGKPYCDNAIVYIFNKLNFEVINDPSSIKTYHYHDTNLRSYDMEKDRVKKDIMYIKPFKNKNKEAFTNLDNSSYNLYICIFILVIIAILNYNKITKLFIQ